VTFRVSYSGAVRASLKELLEDALRRDPQLGRRALDAAKTIDARLRTSARDWGEACFVRPDLALEVRLAIFPPLAVTFAVHQQLDVVFVQRFNLLIGPQTA
jgi:hypothetical protein